MTCNLQVCYGGDEFSTDFSVIYTRLYVSIPKVFWVFFHLFLYYRQTSNTSRTLESNKLTDHSDVVGALPVGAAPTTSSLLT